ncbi:MAG: hypothetical protein GXO26_09315 [Crenarchaeota archaeon]|nr:hypothetical protein [Thermoproteota archaeon]
MSINVEKLDEELRELLTSSTDLKNLLCKLAKHVLKLLSSLYGPDTLRSFLSYVSSSREYILAIYLCIALSIAEGIINVHDVPDDVARELISRLLILYEKSKHIRNLSI